MGKIHLATISQVTNFCSVHLTGTLSPESPVQPLMPLPQSIHSCPLNKNIHVHVSAPKIESATCTPATTSTLALESPAHPPVTPGNTPGPLQYDGVMLQVSSLSTMPTPC